MRAVVRRCGGKTCPSGTCDHDRTASPRQSLATAAVESVLRSPGHPLEPRSRSAMEARFGHDFGDVRIHADESAAESARGIGAAAYTFRRDVAFGAGRYRPGTPEGDRLLAHELAHVVQQSGAAPPAGPVELGDPDDPAEAEAETAAAQVAAGGTEIPIHHRLVTAGTIRRTLECPPRLAPDAPLPPGWKAYQGNPSWFHCGFRGILEDRVPTPANPQAECFYDHAGVLVDESHQYAGCRGTPNQYDSKENAWDHTFSDTGGIWHSGGTAFAASRAYDVDRAIATGIQVAQTIGAVGAAFTSALGQAIALGIMTGVAIVDPANWTFHGVPARSVRHLNVMGGLLGSLSMAGNPNTLLSNLTRRLDGFGVPALLAEIAEDVNSALQAAGRPRRITAADVGALSMLHLVQALEGEGLMSFRRPPADVAAERLAEMTQPSGGSP